MKPLSPIQLARLLDQLQAGYPNGIPLSVITSGATESGDVVSSPYLLVAVSSQGALRPEEEDLLDSIATRGLKLPKDSFSKTVVSDEASVDAALASGASVVLVFGGSGPRGFRERDGGGRALFTFAVSDLIADAAHKKELWRELQTLL